MWFMLVVMVVSALVSYSMAPKQQPPPPAALQDFNVPTAEEGRAIPVVFGTVYITGPNVIWYGHLRARPVRTKSGK